MGGGVKSWSEERTPEKNEKAEKLCGALMQSHSRQRVSQILTGLECWEIPWHEGRSLQM